MTSINWLEEVHKRKEELLNDTKKLLAIKSVLDEENSTPDAPLGKEIKEALQFLLDLGSKDGFTSKNVDNLAGHVEYGEGKDILGILCHVDVVPEGDGWTSDPFTPEIRDGKLYARGAIDDKGPTMAAYYGMKIVKELGLPLSKRVRMIIGTDEESNWRCVEHYFQKEEMPTLGFAPDADFPIIYAEKGIADFDLLLKGDRCEPFEGFHEVIEFSAGRRYNMVPDFAKAVLAINGEHTKVVQMFETYLKENNLEGRDYVESGQFIFEVYGVSAHGMEPNKGVNAGLYLAKFLSKLPLDCNSQNYVSFVSRFFFQDSRGKALGISYSDDITGDLTINVGVLSFDQDNGGKIGLNLRYPVTHNMDECKVALEELVKKEGFSLENFSDSKPHHVDENDFLIQTLKKVYLEQTGERAELLSIGGGTYARSLSSGVAFGALFPGRPDVAHQKDEYMHVEDLVKATAIYAQAIYELAK